MYCHEYQDIEKAQVSYGVWQDFGNNRVWSQVELVVLADEAYRVPAWKHKDQLCFHSHAQAYVDPSLEYLYSRDGGPALRIVGMVVTLSDFESIPKYQHHGWVWNGFFEAPPKHLFKQITPDDRQVVSAVVHAGALRAGSRH